MFGADVLSGQVHRRGVLGHAELIARLEALKGEGRTSNAEIGRLLSLPNSRITDVFSGKRQVRVDEMKKLVDEFGLEGDSKVSPPTAPSAENLEPILDALLPLAPQGGRMTDQSRRALAEALSYGLGLLGNPLATPATGDALAVASRAAVDRFRAIATA